MSDAGAPVVRVFALDDTDWWAGESLAACVAAARAECGADCYPDSTDQHEIGPEAMQKLKFVDDDGQVRTFAEQLALEVAGGARFPSIFASTDW